MAWYWIVLIVLAALFALTIVVYMFNLDMKLASKMQPLINKHYDKIEREARQ
ncbi:MAG: hypothetical protein KIG37_08430 [Oscillospiraceae bacterium]|nr:hypothetical protein [Oscillospiraceae bacterium]